MTAAAPPPVPENGLNGAHHGHLPMNLPRFHPIAMNPNPSMPPESMMQGHHFRPFQPPVQEPAPPHLGPSQIDQIEARLRQLEHEEAARMAARSHLLAIRKREDEEFRRVTESAEAEEEDLRRQRKRLKRESMGLGYNATMDSPPSRPTPPRRLSETNAATTLAFFKQQSPPEPRPAPMPPQAAPPPPAPMTHHDPNAAGTMRRKQKYTIKNVEAWGERHGRPAAHDPSGRALWKRPSDGSLVYLTCPVPGCGKADFVTLHGFMCHLTKKHKDRSLGSQSRALEACGIVYDPNAPLPPVSTVNRASTEESRLESATDGYPHDMDYSSPSEDEGDHEPPYPVKIESAERVMPAPPPPASSTPAEEPTAPPKANGSTKQSISSIIDRNPEVESQDSVAPHAPPPSQPSETTAHPSHGHTVAVKENLEPAGSYRVVSENNESKDVGHAQ